MGRDGLSVIERAARVLELFATRGAAALPFTDLLEGGGMSRATTHRVLADMVEQGFLSQADHRQEYRLGPLLLSTAVLAGRHADVRQAARPVMTRLRDQCGETVVLAELHGESVVPVERVDGLYEMRMSQEIGQRYPLHAGATAKALLAHVDAARAATYLDQAQLEPLTERTVGSRVELEQQVTRVRELGVAVSAGERVPEAIALSAPVFGPGGELQAALTISGVASRFTLERSVEEAVEVRRCADEISTALGCSPAPPNGQSLTDDAGALHAQLVDYCRDVVGPVLRAAAVG